MIADDWSGARAASLEVLLAARGAAQLPHPGGTLQGHLKRTARRLETWGARPELILAGLCHAAYGTQGFPTPLFRVSERGLLRSHIGDEAEAIVYAYCADDRRESPSARTRLRDRFTGDEWVPAGWLGDALAELTAANELDIVEHAELGASELRASGMWASACVVRLTQAGGAAVHAAACTSGLWNSEPAAGGDREIAYRDLGASGARVVLWHGGAPPERTWSRQHVLASALSLRIPWRRGFAPSAAASRQDWAVNARDLLRIMPGRVHVVGHSYGALSALVAAANAPDRFASLTLIEPPLWSVAADEPAVQRLGALSQAFVRGDRDAREAFLALAAMPSDDLETARLERRARGLRDPGEAAPALDELLASRLPIAVVSGQHDAGLECVCDRLSGRLEAQRWRLPGSGHAVQRQPTFNEQLAGFVASLSE